MPNNAKDFVKMIHDDLSKVAKRVDTQYPDLTELIIDEQGNPILKKRHPKQRSQQAIWLSQEIRNRMQKGIYWISYGTHITTQDRLMSSDQSLDLIPN